MQTDNLDSLFGIGNNSAMEPFAGMEAFVRVVETGSFTAAAERLQMAKSSVSETVRALEERLGVRLLDRTTRSVRPTEAGLKFYARCRRLIEDAEAARAEAQTLSEALSGRLRIGAPDAFASRFIVPALAGFLKSHPALAIDLVATAAQSKLVDEGLDLAIRIVAAPHDNLVVRRIGKSRIIVVAAPAYLAVAGDLNTPQELVNHSCIGFSPLPWRETWSIGGETISVEPVLLTNETESLRAAALAGLGLAAVPEWLVGDALAAGALTQVLADYETPESGVFAVYPTNRLLTPSVRSFVDCLARDLKSRGLGAG